MENIDINKKYSTDEVFTGEYWVDNKPIYKKSWVVAGSEFTKETNGSRVLYTLTSADGLIVSDQIINPIKADGFWLTIYLVNGSYKNRVIPLFGSTMNTNCSSQITSCLDYYDYAKAIFPYFQHTDGLSFYSNAIVSLSLTVYYVYL